MAASKHPLTAHPAETHPPTSGARWLRPGPKRTALWVIALVALLGSLTACSGDESDDASGAGGDNTNGSSEPVRGGDVVYALEAETSGGWCIPEAQLAISGMMVAWSIYDFLFVPSEDGFEPFLAESVDSNDDDTEWTIGLREGVKFHDGTLLDATVVKNNIDSWRGAYPNRKSALGPYTLSNIDTVEVIDDLTVSITTKVPWPALPAYLYGGGRSGVMAQAQLDDPDTCDTKLIGTGPFMLDQWAINDHLSAKRNPDYWRTDEDGVQLPYLDSITFRPIPDAQTRVNGLLSGEYDLAMTSSAPATETLDEEADAGNINLVQSSINAEVGFMMLNEARPPFDDPVAREAVATALDRQEYSEVVSLGLLETASGPFPPDAPGYLEDTGFPEFDPERAEELVADYEGRTGQPFEFTYHHASDEDNLRAAQFIQEQLAKAGIEVNLKASEQAALINTALGGDWDAMAFRNFPAGVPDGNYVWWHSGSPVNFGRINDPEVDALLDEGRTELDEDASDEIYQNLNRRLAEQVHFVWLDWTLWSIGAQPDIEGIMGTTLPDGAEPSAGLATGHATSGIHRTG